ncbi:MAG: hypothetical protein E7640_06540 [Ruminococcaceae bacterium]|nr:hypothetical protein [Oscillospiraceae bacterium]
MKELSPLAKRIIICIILTLVVGAAVFYVWLPPLNPQSEDFWSFLSLLTIVACLPFFGLKLTKKNVRGKGSVSIEKDGKFRKWILIVIAVPIVIPIIGGFASSTLFNAKDYASVISVTESDFAADMPESTEITNIALMDTDSARMLGNKELGSLSDVISQYNLSDYYTQINYKGSPKKVANLEYDDFFKWLGNKDKGVPGMVMVDPVGSSAEYLKFKKPMYYVESAFFGQDLFRKLRFSYPTKIFNSVSFEIDENGDPYYIVACSRPQVGLFGAHDIEEVIIFDPCDGSSEIYPVEETPSWIDIVYTGQLACEKYNWHGTLSGGFFNSIIGNVGCKVATDDFGYIVIGDDVWYFTGVTSAVSSDKSNIGFIISNARTGEYKFYPVIGAEEHSAMAAAQGEVQEKGYVASFPSLVNIAGEATYIMVLKDAAGLVKLYALVNVENYSIVATGTTQTEAMNAYKLLLRQNDVDIGDTETDKSTDITVENVRIIENSGVSTVYVTAEGGNVYKGYLSTDEALILVRTGDRLTVSYTETDTARIFLISSWNFSE